MKKVLLMSMLWCIALCSIVHAQQQIDTLRVFFAIDKSMVDNSNAKLLDKLIADTGISSIAIYGYADFLGSAAYNRQLSEKRSASMSDYLMAKGINRKKIILVKGEGIHPNSAEENRQDFSDKGIQAHRVVQVVYSTKSQDSSNGKKLSEEIFKENAHIVLENILFYNNSDRFRPESFHALEELLEIMQEYSTLKIEIQGHICCHSEHYIDKDSVSLRRAKAVHDYLIENGIDSTRLSYKGFGSSRKIYPLEQDEYERTMNRRVEILILEK
jgi:outer membrane protein OmpA-like peptidoglycan-associated protein